MLLRIYLIIAAASILVADKLWYILRQSYSWWLVPLLIIAIFVGLVLVQFIVFAIMILTTNLKGKAGKGEKFFRFLVKQSLPTIVALAKVIIRSQGLEKVPEDGRMLLVCNHQYDFDPAIIYYCLPDAELSFIGKKEILTEKKFFAKAMMRLSCLFIDRENDREAAKTIINAIKAIKEDRNSIALFPEGYCSKDDELLPLRNGSLKIALKTQVPVVVCVINNTKKIVPNMFRKTTVVDFRVVDVINPEQYENMTTADLGEVIYDKMQTALNEIRTAARNTHEQSE